ncbi:DNA-directed RNA polymerase subunit M [Candidatus Acidianus copahuensis]|uniref:DNA-directed RNA polymerase subunit M n=1 Tax=Candidatus Acidianus copahuensis TaxID=1160895 RepID=A0A031LV78_9CREN|nr:RPA12/RPB9/RPC11 RNA polymerase family protein [Candidatus Acidianus copahuensis]EZQ11038.1 DNA-directed RNA polymerase subunit M [Candidatus Acidianus copahuensis]
MKFCPKCGGILMPTKKDGKTILKCRKCGYEEEMDNKAKKEYQIKESTKNEKVLTTSIVSEKEGRKRDEEEWEQEREEYYKEIGLELLRDEFEGNEENDED